MRPIVNKRELASAIARQLHGGELARAIAEQRVRTMNDEQLQQAANRYLPRPGNGKAVLR